VLVDEAVEGREVDGFLVVHVSHERAEVRVFADDDGGLGGVDECCGEFAGLVDSKLIRCWLARLLVIV
jgi:hypothetical protein